MDRILHVVGTVLVGCVLAAPGGCASEPRADAAPARSEQRPEAIARARTVRIFRAGDGTPATWDTLVSAASGADALIVGENHGHELGLAFASELWADVLARQPQAVLSMEFFTRDEQARLDDYLKGLSDETAFLKATRRIDDESYPPGHRAMVEAARARARPVIASNAPRVYVRTASRESFERLAALTPEQRRLFRVPDRLPDGRYRADYNALMSDPSMASHGGPPKMETPDELRKRLDGGFRAQSLWDWTMAESVAEGIDRCGRPVVHVVGRFHTDFAGGLLQALTALRPGTKIVAVSVVDAQSETLRASDRDRADFVVYVGSAE